MTVSSVSLWATIYQFASTRNLFVYFRRRYSHQILDKLNRVLKLKDKTIRLAGNVTFLKDCLKAYVAPSGIRHRVRKANPKRPWSIERAFLRDDINKELDCLEQTNDDYYRNLTNVLTELSTFDQFRFCKLLNETATRLRKEVSASKSKYLQSLCRSQLGQGELDHDSIVNLTDVVLTEMEKDVLCRGLNFGIPPNAKNLRESVESEFELCWEQLVDLEPVSQQKKQDCKTAMTDICRQYVNQKPDTSGYPLNKQHLKTEI